MPAAKSGADTTTAARDARRMSTLLEMSQALSGTLNLKAAEQHHVAGVGGEHVRLEDGRVRCRAAGPGRDNRVGILRERDAVT